jgi:hypothetical protein
VQGPRDFSELEPQDATVRVDLGALLIPADAGVEVQVQADQATGTISQVNLVVPDGAVQVQPYAAPRTGGMWLEIQQELAKSIEESDGQVREVQGPFGSELHAVLPAGQGKQAARFAAVEGPRWLVRLVFLGKACEPGSTAAKLEEVVRSLVIVRGDVAMPPRAPLPLRLPPEAGQEVAAPSATGAGETTRPRLTLPERGPEITEIR